MIYSEDSLVEKLITQCQNHANKIKKAETKTVEDLIEYLRFWWSQHYNRPMKEPLLYTYTIQELLLEFYLHTEETEEQKSEKANDLITKNADELALLFERPEAASSGKPADLSQEEQDFMRQQFPEWNMTEKDFS